MSAGSLSATAARIIEAKSIADKIVGRSSRSKSEQIRVDWLTRMAPPVLYFLSEPAGIIGYMDALLGPASLRTGRPFEAGQPAIDLERERLALRRAMKIVSAVFSRCRQFVTYRRSKQHVLLQSSMRSMGSRLLNASAALAPLLALAGAVEMAALTLMPYPVDPDDPDLPLARDGLPLATQTRRVATFWSSLSRDARLAMIMSERKSLALPSKPASASPHNVAAWCLCPQCQTRRMGLDELVVMLGVTYVDELERLAAFLEGRERTTERHAVRLLLYRSLALYSESLLAEHVNILEHHDDAARRGKRSSAMHATVREMVAEFHRRRMKEEAPSSTGSVSHVHAGATPCVECQRLRKEHGMPSSASEPEDAAYADGNDNAILLDDELDFGHHSELDGNDSLLGEEFPGSTDGGGSSLFGPDPLEHFADIKRRAPSSRMMAGLPAHPLESTFRYVCHPVEADDILESFVDVDLRMTAFAAADNATLAQHAALRDYPQSIVFAESDALVSEGQRIFQLLVSELFSQRLMREYHEAVVRLRQTELLAEVEREETEAKEREANRFAAKARKKEQRHKRHPATAVHEEERSNKDKDGDDKEEAPSEIAHEQPEPSKESDVVLDGLAQETTPKKKKKKKRSKQASAPRKAVTDVSDHEHDMPQRDGECGAILPDAKEEQSETTTTRMDMQTTDDDDPFFLIHSSIGQLSLIDTAEEEDEVEEEVEVGAEEQQIPVRPRLMTTSRFESLFSKPVVQAPPGFTSPPTSPVATVPASVWSSSLFLPPNSPSAGSASAPPPVFGPALLGRSLFSSSSASSISDVAPPGLSKKQP